MNLDDMKFRDVIEILEALKPSQMATATETSPFIGRYVLVRTYSAGVHAGTLAKKDGTNVLLPTLAAFGNGKVLLRSTKWLKRGFPADAFRRKSP